MMLNILLLEELLLHSMDIPDYQWHQMDQF